MHLQPRISLLATAAGFLLLAGSGSAHAAPQTAPGHPVITAPTFDTTVTIPVVLSWTNPESTVAGTTTFTVHFDDLEDYSHPFDFSVPASAGPGATTSTLRGVPDGLQAGHVYYYKVSACNPGGCGDPSTQSPFTVSAVTSDASDGASPTTPVVTPAAPVAPVSPAASPAIAPSDEAILHGTYLFDLETGRQSEPGDIWWEQIDGVSRALVPENGAAILPLGMVDFNSIGGVDLQALDAMYGSTPLVDTPLTGNQLVAGTVFAVRTRGGSYAKVQVVHFGYDLDLRWVTYAAE